MQMKPRIGFEGREKLWLTMCYGFKDKPKRQNIYIYWHIYTKKLQKLRLGRLRSNSPITKSNKAAKTKKQT